MRGLVHIFCFLMLFCILVSATHAVPMVYVDDDFESYADTTAMQAIWGAAGAGTLDTANGFSGTQSMAHPGGTDNTINLAADIIPTDAEPVVLRGRILDDGMPNKRFSIGLRSLSTFPLFEMGRYNSVIGEDYYARINTFPGLSPDWVSLGLGAAVAGWHTFEATFTGTDITVTVDLNSDGILDYNNAFVLAAAYTTGLGQLRLGGPSNLSSPGGGGNFDDIFLATVPEPATGLWIALSGLGLLVCRRR